MSKSVRTFNPKSDPKRSANAKRKTLDRKAQRSAKRAMWEGGKR